MARRRRPPRSGALTELQPAKLLSQIVALQLIYYFTAAVLILFTTLVSGTKFTLDLIFSWRDVRGDATTGWVWGFLWVLDGGVVVAIAMMLLVARSKLVLDFALSLHVIHLLVVTFYTEKQLPRHALWWLTMAVSSALSVALGMWGCRYRELQPITFGGLGGGTANPLPVGHSQQTHDDEEQGVARGRGRGRGRDGAGEYELANMGEGSDAHR